MKSGDDIPASGERVYSISRVADAQFTGERFVFGSDLSVDVETEHIHRYLWAASFCRGKSVLDVACGEGYGCNILAQEAKSVVGIDKDAGSINAARNKYAAADIDFIQAECHALPFPDDTFDVVCSFETIEHITDQDVFLHEVRRVLKKNGLLMCSTPDRDVYGMYSEKANPYHVSELSLADFRTLLGKYFANVSMSGHQFLSCSHISSLAPQNPQELTFFREDQPGSVLVSRSFPSPKYVIAFASNAELFSTGCSIYEGSYDRQIVSALQGGALEQKKYSEQLEALVLTEREQFNKLEQELVAKNEHIAQLETLMLTEREQFSKLEREFVAKGEHIAQLEALMQTERNQFKILEHEFAAKCGHVEQLSAEVAEEKSKVAHTEQKVWEFESLVQSERLQFGNLEREFTEKCAHVARLDALMQAEREQYRKLEQEFAVTCVHIVKLENLMQTERKQFNGLEQEFAAKCEHVGQLEALLQAEREEYQRLDQEYSAKNEDLKRSNAEIVALRAQLERADHTIAALHRQVVGEKAKRRVRVCEEGREFTLLSAETESLRGQLFQARRLSGELQLQVSEGREEKLQLQQEFEIKCAHVGQLEALMQEERNEYVRLLREFETKCRHVNLLQGETDQLGKESLRLREALFFLVERLDTIAHRVHRLQKTDDWRLGYFICSCVNALRLRPPRRTSLHMLLDEVTRYKKWLTGFGNEMLSSPGISSQLCRNGIPSFSLTLEGGEHFARAGRSAFPLFAEVTASIIIPAYNQWEYTKACLDSICAVCSTGNTPFEVIIADDHSTDATLTADHSYENLIVVRTEHNSGFLLNCNNAATRARGRYLVFLNNDTVVTGGWLSSLVRLMDADATIAVAGSKLIYPDGQLQEAGGIVWKDGSAWNYGRGKNPDAPEFNYVKEADYISGASILVRKSFWEEVGGFDARYAPAYCEDSDLAFEARARGYRVVYQPASVVVHYEGRSHGTDVGAGTKAYQIENARKFFDKWRHVLESEHLSNGDSVYIARDRSIGRKHLLYIDHYVPHFDQDAGSRTAFHYLRLLRNMGISITFLGDNFYPHQPYTMHLQQLGIEVLYGPEWAHGWQDWFKENARHIDYVFLNRPHIAEKYIDFIRDNSRSTVLYYGHDLHFLREERKLLQSPENGSQDEAIKMRALELDVCSKADVIYYPSPVEVDLLSPLLPGKTIRAIPAYIYPPPPARLTDFAQTEGLLFIGGFGHPPNAEAVRHLIDNILPHVVKDNPEIKLYIVGSKAPAWLMACADEHVVVLGRISDDELEKMYARVRLAVVPLLHGAGIKGKLVEALYYGVPVVASTIGAEGLPPCDAIRVCDDPAVFAHEIVALYEQPALLQELSVKAHRFVQDNFGEDNARRAISRDITTSNGGRNA